MTTLIGVKGYDPILKKGYVLMTSDSKWSNEKTKEFGLDAKKIIFNKNSNLIIGHSGTGLILEGNEFYGKTLEKINNLISKEYKKNEEVLKDFNVINKYENCSFLLATNIGSLDLIYNYKKDINFLGKKVSHKNISGKSRYAFIGSGNKFAYNKIVDKLEILPKNKYGVEIKLNNLLEILKIGLTESRKNDIFTNGKMNIAVLQENGYFGMRGFSDLYNDEDFNISKEKAIERIRKETGTTKKSLDKILLRV